MMFKVSRRARAPLTALSLVLTASTVGAAPLCELSTEVPWDRSEKAELAEPGLAGAVAMSSAWAGPSLTSAEELRSLARDASDHVRISAAVGLARAIERASAPERIDLVCTWAVSEHVDERLALARALTWSTPVFVADLVLEQLASDPSAVVRGAALAAVARHFHENSAAYASVVSRCLDDADPNVKKLARALMQRARG